MFGRGKGVEGGAGEVIVVVFRHEVVVVVVGHEGAW
jgi:hypothetical protein